MLILVDHKQAQVISHVSTADVKLLVEFVRNSKSTSIEISINFVVLGKLCAA